MKKMIVLALMIIGVQLAVNAQDTKRDTIRSHYKGEARTKMKNELNLSKEQSQKMKEIREESKQKMQALRDDKSISDADRKAKAADLMKERREKTESILNTDQKQKMKEWSEKRKEHMKDGDRHKGMKRWKERKEQKEKAEQPEKSEQ